MTQPDSSNRSLDYAEGLEAALVRYGLRPSDIPLLQKLFVGVVAAVIFVAAFAHLEGMYGRKFYDLTGFAKWIWPKVDITREVPVVFFATREFDLPADRYFTKIKVAADPEYTLYFNGDEIGHGSAAEETTLDTYDVSSRARTLGNRIVIAVHATQGVGGLLASVDVSSQIQNLAVTDERWHIAQRWTPDLVIRDSVPVTSPNVIGLPPVGRWNFLQTRDVSITSPRASAPPLNARRFTATLPSVKVVEGTAIVSSASVPATVWDFGNGYDGRVRLTRGGTADSGELVRIRCANSIAEVQAIEGSVIPLAFGAGESAVVDPEDRHFRFVVVYGSAARPDVLVRK